MSSRNLKENLKEKEFTREICILIVTIKQYKIQKITLLCFLNSRENNYIAILICMLAFLMITIDKIKTRRIITSLLNRQWYFLTKFVTIIKDQERISNIMKKMKISENQGFYLTIES